MNSRRYDGAQYKFREVASMREIVMSSTELFADEVAYLEKNREVKKFMPITYAKVRKDLDALGTKMAEMGLAGKRIAVIGDTSYHWILTYFTTVCGIGVIVPLDKNLPQEELLGLVERAGVSAIFYGKKSRASIAPLFENSFDIQYFVGMDEEEDSETSLSMKKMISAGEQLLEEGDRSYIDLDVDPDEMACLMFTSGTTGMAKGVMLSQRNIAANCYNMSKFFKIPDPGIVLSILPVHHAYEMTCDIWTTFYQGKTIAICEGLRYIQKNMAEVQANVMLGVPLVFEKLHKGMWKQAKARGEEEKLRSAIQLSRRLKLYNNPAVVKRMFKSIHQGFGGGMQKLVAGGAAIDPKVIEDFEAMGFTMIQGYGMSENAPIIAVNPDRYSKAASAGKPMPGTEVRIIDQDLEGIGEIICRGPSVMMGYYENPEATEEVLVDGWLHTGDLGYFDEDGFLYITGRKKTVIVTKGGKNIFPEEVEAVLLEESELIQEALVHGVADERVGNIIVTADIYPNYSLLSKQKGEMNDSEIYHFFKDLIDEINDKMPPYKRIKRINIREEEFAKTTTGKIKRFGNVAGGVAQSEEGGSKNKRKPNYAENRELKQKIAKQKIKSLIESKDAYITYTTGRPIVDLRNLLETSADLYGDRTAIYRKKGRELPYSPVSYSELHDDVNALGTGMLNFGMSGAHIAIMGRNCYPWATTYLATVCGAGVSVPLSLRKSEEEIRRRLIESDVSVVFFEKKYQEFFLEMREDAETKVKTLVCFDEAEEEKGILSWREVMKTGEAALKAGDRQFLDEQMDPDKLAVISYTSGVTKEAKPVMLSMAAICDNLMSAPTIVDVRPEDVFLSVMPMHHIYETSCGFLMPLYKGAAIAFCENREDFKKNLMEIHPTVLVGVPELLEMLHARVWKELREEGGLERFRNVVKANRITSLAGVNIVKPLAGDVRRGLGGKLRLMVCAGGVCDQKTIEFFNMVGITTVQGYGLAECSPIAAINPDTKGRMKIGSCGHLLPGMEVKIINKDCNGMGEICLKGSNLMLGYYNHPEMTEQVIRQGWLHTGDIGFYDADHFLYVVGRKKTMIDLGRKRRVYPEILEGDLRMIPYIHSATIQGRDSDLADDRIAIAAVLDIDEEIAKGLYGDNLSEKELLEQIWEDVDKLNGSLESYQRITQVEIVQ